MKKTAHLLTVSLLLVYLAAAWGCGGEQIKPKTEPPPPPPKAEPTIEELRKPVNKDTQIYKAASVIQRLGRRTKEHMSFEKINELTGGEGGAVDPDWFYDSYTLDLNEKGYWVTVIYGTAKRAVDRDDRIEKALAGLPMQSITVKLEVPGGKKYILNDQEGDGVLDFAKDVNQKNTGEVDIPLLDRMQEKYTWILGLIKKHYKGK